MAHNTGQITRQQAIVLFILVSTAAVSIGIRLVRRTEPVESPTRVQRKDRPSPEQSVGLQILSLEEQAIADSNERGKTAAVAAKPKAGSAKPEDSKVVQKISLGENEELHFTADGKIWSVSKQPDGSVVKMQVHIDEATGEIRVLDIADGKPEVSKNLQKVSMGDNVDIYIGDDGRMWSITKQPDGSVTKMEVAYDETTGDVYVLDAPDSNSTSTNK